MCRLLYRVTGLLSLLLGAQSALGQISIFSENFDGVVQPYTANAPYISANCSNQVISSTGLTCALAFVLTPISTDASGSGKFLFEGTSSGPNYKAAFYNIALTGQQWVAGYAFTISFKVALADNVNPPSLQPMVNGNSIGTAVTPTLVDSWQTLSFNYTPAITLVSPTFTLYDNQASGLGNDFGIDDIEVTVLTLDALPLPHFLGFSASPAARGVGLSWDEQGEPDAPGFLIERSSNGKSFDSIGEVAAYGPQSYSFTDLSPMAGMNYYRASLLVAGTWRCYSAIAAVQWGQLVSPLAVFPSPASSSFDIYIPWPQSASYEVELLSVSGAIVFRARAPLSGGRLHAILPANILSGAYLVRASSARDSYSAKLLITR